MPGLILLAGGLGSVFNHSFRVGRLYGYVSFRSVKGYVVADEAVACLIVLKVKLFAYMPVVVLEVWRHDRLSVLTYVINFVI